MPAYLIANMTVTDPDLYAQYRASVPAVLAQYGGRYIVRGGAVHAVEGDAGLDRVVVVEFESVAAARRFHDSPEYAPLIALRGRAARSSVAVVEGVSA